MITEFDKWDWINCCEKCDDNTYKGLSCGDCESLRQQGWFAALKWVKSQANDIGCYGECVSVDIINKELQNLNHNDVEKILENL